MLTGCPEATYAATPAWVVCVEWSAVTVRCWRSTWPTTAGGGGLRPRLPGAGPPDLAVPPWQLGKALEWGLGVAHRQGFAGVVVACEPTGHRWREVVEHATGWGWRRSACSRSLLQARMRALGQTRSEARWSRS